MRIRKLTIKDMRDLAKNTGLFFTDEELKWFCATYGESMHKQFEIAIEHVFRDTVLSYRSRHRRSSM